MWFQRDLVKEGFNLDEGWLTGLLWYTTVQVHYLRILVPPGFSHPAAISGSPQAGMARWGVAAHVSGVSGSCSPWRERLASGRHRGGGPAPTRSQGETERTAGGAPIPVSLGRAQAWLLGSGPYIFPTGGSEGHESLGPRPADSGGQEE